MTRRYWRPNWITVGAACLLGTWALLDSQNLDSFGLRVIGILLFLFAAGVAALLLQRSEDAR